MQNTGLENQGWEEKSGNLKTLTWRGRGDSHLLERFQKKKKDPSAEKKHTL